MIGSVFSIFGQLITVISLTSTLLIANTDLSLLLLISLIPFLRLSQEKPVMHFRKDRYPKTKNGYLSGILTGRGYAKEVRLFGYEVFGHNGVEKSTLVQLWLRLYSQTSVYISTTTE